MLVLTSETIAILSLALFCNAMGSVLLKKGAIQWRSERHRGKIGNTLAFAGKMLKSGHIIFGLLLQLGAVIGWLVFISRVALSFAFPLSSINNVTILLASRYFLREKISSQRWVGVLLILCGITLITNP